MNLPVKYRPKTFEEVTGQSHVTRTLQNALRTGRISQAYLFAGPRGVGKTTTARIFAKGLNCERGVTPHPCNSCEICKEIDEGRSLDVIEIDGASNRGIEEIRNLREKIRFTPTRARYKVYIIDEVHMLTTEAFNALLKTLEEPPPHVIFIFATTEPRKIPETVISRTQRFDFRPLSVKEIAERLRVVADKEGIDVEENALLRIAKYADGSLRDGLALLEQLYVFSGGKIKVDDVNQVLGIIDEEFFVKLFDSALKGDTRSVLSISNEAFEQGYSIHEFARSFSEAIRELVRAKFMGEKNPFSKIAEIITDGQLTAAMKIALDIEEVARYSQNPRVGIDYHLIRLSYLDRILKVDEILEKSGVFLISEDRKAKEEERRQISREEKEEILTELKEGLEKTGEKVEEKKDVKSRLKDLLSEKPKRETSTPSEESSGQLVEKSNESLVEETEIMNVLREHVPFVSMVIEKSYMRLDDKTLKIGVEDEFEKDLILRHENKILFLLYDRFKTKFSLDIQLKGPDTGGDDGVSSKINMDEYSPVLQKLIQKFDLEVIKDV